MGDTPENFLRNGDLEILEGPGEQSASEPSSLSYSLASSPHLPPASRYEATDEHDPLEQERLARTEPLLDYPSLCDLPGLPPGRAGFPARRLGIDPTAPTRIARVIHHAPELVLERSCLKVSNYEAIERRVVDIWKSREAKD